jgi:NitT/TauT family transport system substrate-binding protein
MRVIGQSSCGGGLTRSVGVGKRQRLHCPTLAARGRRALAPEGEGGLVCGRGFCGRVTPLRSVLARVLAGITALAVACVPVAPALAQDQLKIGLGYGLAFLPIYVCQEQKLIEKHAKALHLDVKVSYQRFLGAGPVQAALGSGEIDIGPFGTAPLLAAWEKGKDTPQQILAVSGLTTMPLTLVTNQPNVTSLADFQSSDRIAMPSLTAPQMYVLEMASEKTFGTYDKLHDRVVAMSPADAITALVDGSGAVTAYFASPPFAQLALRDAKVHRVLSSVDVMNGKASFLMLGASRAYIEAHPQIAEAIDKAIDEAARLIRDDPRRAAQIYLTHEPSMTLSGAAVEAVLRDIKDEFGSAVYGVQVFADFMSRRGELKTPPQSWKDIVAPSLASSPST